MRTLVSLLAVVLLSATLAWAQGDEANDKTSPVTLGIGIHFTANPEFPTGVSARLWIMNQFGLEVDIWGVELQPSFTLRAFYRVLQSEIIALYVGGGVAFFSRALSFASTLQGVGGLDVHITPNLVLDVEVGALGGARNHIPITAGVGFHFYL